MSNDEKPTPALFDHAVRVYEAMTAGALKEPILVEGVEGEATVTANVYTGHLTRLFAELGIANPYYSKIMKTLEGLRCVEQLRRGGGAATSKWILHDAPFEESFKEYVEKKRQPQTRMHQLEQRVRDLNIQLQAMSANLDRLNDLVATSKGDL